MACHSAVLRGYLATCLARCWSPKTTCVGSVLSPHQIHRSFVTVDIFKLCKFGITRSAMRMHGKPVYFAACSFLFSNAVLGDHRNELQPNFSTRSEVSQIWKWSFKIWRDSLRLKRGPKMPILRQMLRRAVKHCVILATKMPEKIDIFLVRFHGRQQMWKRTVCTCIRFGNIDNNVNDFLRQSMQTKTTPRSVQYIGTKTMQRYCAA